MNNLLFKPKVTLLSRTQFSDRKGIVLTILQIFVTSSLSEDSRILTPESVTLGITSHTTENSTVHLWENEKGKKPHLGDILKITLTLQKEAWRASATPGESLLHSVGIVSHTSQGLLYSLSSCLNSPQQAAPSQSLLLPISHRKYTTVEGNLHQGSHHGTHTLISICTPLYLLSCNHAWSAGGQICPLSLPRPPLVQFSSLLG